MGSGELMRIARGHVEATPSTWSTSGTGPTPASRRTRTSPTGSPRSPPRLCPTHGAVRAALGLPVLKPACQGWPGFGSDNGAYVNFGALSPAGRRDSGRRRGGLGRLRHLSRDRIVQIVVLSRPRHTNRRSPASRGRGRRRSGSGKPSMATVRLQRSGTVAFTGRAEGRRYSMVGAEKSRCPASRSVRRPGP